MAEVASAAGEALIFRISERALSAHGGQFSLASLVFRFLCAILLSLPEVPISHALLLRARDVSPPLPSRKGLINPTSLEIFHHHTQF